MFESETSKPLQQPESVTELEQLQKESDYDRAHREFMKAIEKGFDLGTCGKITWTRDELHER